MTIKQTKRMLKCHSFKMGTPQWMFMMLIRSKVIGAENPKTIILKVQSCKFYNNKYMIAWTKISNTEAFAFIAVVVFKLLSRKVLFINRKDNTNC